MKNSMKKLLCLLLVFALTVSLSVVAFAKTSSSAIAAPADDTAVFTIKTGDKTYSYTWAELSGKGSFQAVTNTYSAKIDNVETTQDWTGILLSDLLADVEAKSGAALDETAEISATAADNYTVSFTVADAKSAANRYLVACDPVSNYDDANTYANSYVRILRGTLETPANNANIRCLLGLTIADPDLPIATQGKTQGGDIKNSVFYIAVQESANSAMKYYYYTMDELKAYDETHDFSYVDHTVAKTVKGRGASIASLLANITDATITKDMIIQFAESDGYHADPDTPIDDSAYKEKVDWLKNTHVDAGGNTVPALDTVICYQSWTTYDTPTETNVNSTQWDDADENSGYLRAYRQRDDANSAVIKTVMGIVVSTNGQVFTGNDGYTLKAVSDQGAAMQIIESSTGKTYTSQSVTGLVPGMQYAVKAPAITNAAVAAGTDATQIITATAGSDQVVTFTYTENTYVTVNGAAYTYTSYMNSANTVQTPSASEVEAHGVPYGYYNAMYYRYNGIWLDKLAGNSTADITLTDKDGKTMTIPAADAAKYFLAYGYTASKSSTNVSEGKRYTYAYAAPSLLIPAEGTLVGEADVGAAGNKMVPVAMASVKSMTNGSFAGFSDMGSCAWAVDAVNYLYTNKVVNGTSATTYSPTQNITRGDFMLMLVRAYGLTAEANDNFADVAKGSYFYDAIATAKALGIATGDGVNFQPTAPITRQDAMVLLYRTLVLKGTKLDATGSLSAFQDGVSVASYGKDAVTALVTAGIIKGSGTSLNPMNNMTRAEMGVALYRALTTLA